VIIVSDQKRWIFLPGIGSPGKVGNNGIQEVVGSIPIGSTMILNGLWLTDHSEDSRL
jgi:hypothetical protein